MDDGGWDDTLGLPVSNRDQSCAFCGLVRCSHIVLDAASVGFRSYGQSYTLPTFWASCRECESFVAGQDDAALLRRLKLHQEFEDEQHTTAQLAAFRASDLGPTPLTDYYG